MTSSNGKHEFLAAPDHEGDLGTLGSYRVVSELGRGGMGYVFCAEDKRLKRTVALKVMNKKVASTPHSKSRFISEARAMAAVHHDNVATIFEVGEHSGTPFMAMEMLKGETLEEYKLKKERPTYEQIIRFAVETAQGLAAAHAQGIVHRDIKPANIWVESDSERIKILDFGLALAQTPVDQLAGRGSVVGTPGYLSPEQARTEPLDDRSDLYSLGVVLYELATGKLPLRSTTVAGQLIAILAHKPQPIREVNPEIPKPLAELIHKLLRKEPRNRVRSAADLVEELKQVEVECESKSEVGLAINKLQMGLQQVLSKKDNEPGTSAPVAAETDPFSALPETNFASLPDASALDAAPASPLAGAPASKSGVHASPLAGAAAPPKRPGSSPGRRPNQPAKQSQASSPLIKYWPIAVGVGGVALIGLVIAGVMIFGSDSGDSTPGGLAGVTDPSPPEPPKPDPPKQDPPKTQQKSRSTQADKPSGQNQGTQKQGGARKERKKEKQGGGKIPPKPQSQDVAKPNPPQPKTEDKPPVKPNSDMVAVSKPAVQPPPTISDPPRPDDPPPPDAPSSRAQIVTISANDGAGADATVKRGGGLRSTLGMKPNLVIQTRGNKEFQHAYVRFDLSTISPDEGNQGGGGNRKKKEPKERNTGKAALILHCLDDSASGAKIRVYGADNPNSELWVEKEGSPMALSWTKSFSDAGLESLPLLADLSEARVEGRLLKISTPELADFIRKTPLRTATLILAGGKGNLAVQFVSRQGEVGKAPLLAVEILE